MNIQVPTDTNDPMKCRVKIATEKSIVAASIRAGGEKELLDVS